jgi:hypothetical protein
VGIKRVGAVRKFGLGYVGYLNAGIVGPADRCVRSLYVCMLKWGRHTMTLSSGHIICWNPAEKAPELIPCKFRIYDEN